ncbi:MAG TPA: SDR family oxidoreductase [Kofleriaceae bacterium]|jgi:3-oxoacyl-[acyl-carrier protein] reductase|nr:SDR family oxidoreductase [Kofleriaceae bacterium]
MARLDGKICLVAGGTGTVGEEIVKAFVEAGATVVVPSRTRQKLDGLGAFLDLSPGASERLSLLEGRLDDPVDAERLRDEVLRRHGTLHAVVASLGGTWEEQLPLVEVPMETFRSYQNSNLNTHLITARTFLPLLARHHATSYTLLGGVSAVRTVERYSPVSINSAAQLMMAKILMEEMKDAPVRINQVIFGYINTRARAAYAKPEWVTAREVGDFVAYLASNEARMISGSILQFGDRPPPVA